VNPSVRTGARRLGFAARGLLGLIAAYQNLFAWRPSPCRFVPTCSNYALEAVESHGAWRGTGLAARRLLRCHPWGASGPDPVPAHPVQRSSGRTPPEKKVA
jgi:uncharacterized protein